MIAAKSAEMQSPARKPRIRSAKRPARGPQTRRTAVPAPRTSPSSSARVRGSQGRRAGTARRTQRRRRGRRRAQQTAITRCAERTSRRRLTGQVSRPAGPFNPCEIERATRCQLRRSPASRWASSRSRRGAGQPSWHEVEARQANLTCRETLSPNQLAESRFTVSRASCTVVRNCAGKIMVEFFSVAISAIVWRVRS